MVCKSAKPVTLTTYSNDQADDAEMVNELCACFTLRLTSIKSSARRSSVRLRQPLSVCSYAPEFSHSKQIKFSVLGHMCWTLCEVNQNYYGVFVIVMV